MSDKNTIKTCAVPMCKSSTLSTPYKTFFHTPRNTAKRNKWLEAIGLNVADLAPTVHRYCCEDHFDLPNDAENWIQYSITKCKIRLKNDIVPHIFDCQANRKRATSTTAFEDTAKLQRPEFVDVNAISSTSTAFTEYETQATSSGIVFCKTETLDLDNNPSKCCELKASVVPDKPFLLSKGVQVKPRFRSKYIQCTSVPE